MGIANEFTFGGASTSDYGLVVEGPGNYSASTRAVEVINIPGRDGAFVLDKGYYENVPAEFNVVAKGATQSDFKDIISAFRNAIVSQKGYVRLEELYQPGEYRMARYAGGLDEEPAFHGNGAIFKVKFDCKPQRYLTDGETAVSVDDGDTLTNPTLFEAHPLIMAEGFGVLDIDGAKIEIPNQNIGSVELQHNWRGDEIVDSVILATFYDKIPVAAGLVNNGDVITAGMTATVTIQNINTAALRALGRPTNVHVTDENGTTVTDATATARGVSGNDAYINKIECKLTLPISYAYNAAYQSQTRNLHFTLEPSFITPFECYVPIKFWQRTYDGELQLIADIGSVTTDATGQPTQILENYTVSRINLMVKDVRVNSSAPAYGSPTYIDCDLGQVYKETNGERVSLNRFVKVGADLPTLKASPEASVVTFEDLTDVAIIPRWWRV